MKLNTKRKNEISVWEYFFPKNCQWQEKTDKDIEMFFEWSEQGKHRDLLAIPTHKQEGRTYFHALVWGKKYAYIHCHELWDTGMPFIGWKEIKETLPDYVWNFVSKEMHLTYV